MKRFACLVVVAGLGACGGGGGDSIALQVKSVTDLGKFPLPSDITIGRDGGYSGLLGGKTLWTFGDTFTSHGNSVDGSSVLSATAGWSTPAAPLQLVQPVGSDGIPAQLIPYTADELADNEADALNGWALWPSGMLDTGAGAAIGGLVSFQRVKRTSGSGFAAQGVGTARIAVDATVATRGSGDLFTAPEPLFVPQLVDAGFVYALACAPSGFLNQACQVARAPVAQAEERAAYLFWDGSSYQAEIARAATVIDRGNAPSIVFNAHLGCYVSVVSEVISNTILVRTAPAIEGPWDDGVEINPSATGELAPLMSSDYNYLAMEHPELDSADGTQLVISYSRPTTAFAGDVRLAQLTIE